jgi:bacteriocin biosynthesis cyclodehydratase domain-containing protein
MTASYQELADARPRIKQDLLYSQTPDGVLFHNADLGFHISSKSAYQLTSLLMPYLDGEHTLAQLCEGLDDGQRRMVSDLVGAMLERGFARDTSHDVAPATELTAPVAVRFAAQIAYIDHYADSPRRRFAALRAARVAVLGNDRVARWCVAGLVRNGVAGVGVLPSLDRPETGYAEVLAEIAELNGVGCPVEVTELDPPALDWTGLAGYDAVLVTDAGATPGLITGLLADGLPDGVVLVPATTHGNKVLVGPAMSVGRAGCWVCATLRFAANDETGAAADVWSRLLMPATDQPSALSAPYAATLGNLLAYEAFRVLTGTMPADTEGKVIVQRLDSLDAVAEKLSPHPACPYCQADGAEWLDRVLPAEPAMTEAADADDADASQLRLLETAGRLVSPNVGVFTAFDDEQYTQIPVKVSRLRFALGPGKRGAVTAFDTHHVIAARWSALFAAAERYADQVAPLLGLVRTPPGRPVVGPDRLAIGSGSATGVDDIGSWVQATSLLTGDRFAVPAAAVRPFSAYNADGHFVVTSAGAGAGHTLAEALGAGLASALAYDALNRALRGGDVHAVDPATLAADPELEFLRRSADTLDIAAELLDLGEDRVSGVHVVLARTGAGDAPLWTVGADVRRRRALIRALRDLVGTVQVTREFPGEQLETADRLLRAVDPHVMIPVGAVAATQDDGADLRWPAVLRRLAAARRDALAVATAPADLRAAGISTVRVLLVNRA